VIHTDAKILCGAVLAAAIWGAAPAHADPRTAGDGSADMRHSHRFQRELREPARLPPPDQQRPGPSRPGDDRLDEDQQRALMRDLDRANREIYQK